MKNVDSKKLAGTIIGGLAFIFSIIFFTFAWYEWRSNNIDLSGDITDNPHIDITLENDGNISSNDIGPVLNIEDGVIGGFKADNKDVYPGHLYIDLKINRIDSELLSEDLKYLIVKSTVSPRTDDTIDESTLEYDHDNPVASGNFSNLTISTNLLGEDNVQPQTITFYKVIIYIDGNVHNSTNLQEKSIDAKLIITDTEITYLNEVPAGSYVAYTGNNNCVGDACSGVSVSGMGYKSNGWRIAYIDEEGSVHLVSAGAPEKLCTNSDGTTSNSSCSSYETTNGAPLHIANLNNAALKYCNTKYAKDGVCNNETAWAMKENDFTKITGSSSLNSCTGTSSVDCGLDNDLIDIGGYYWFATPYNSASSYSVFDWIPRDRNVYSYRSSIVYGVRPVLRLESSVIITGGEGTKESPYKIALAGVNATNHIENLYKDGSSINTVHIAENTEKPQVHLNEEQSIMLDNNGEYRYYGATPNNYVRFNNELWRIISSSKVYSNENDEVGEQRVRIIRDESIGYHAWDVDSDGTDTDTANNNWSTSTLMTTLNNSYYNRTKGTCYKGELSGNASAIECDFENGDVKGLDDEARSLIDNAMWYLGGYDFGSTALYGDDCYNIERTNSGYGSNPTRYTNAIGIMYPSDYAYAADLSVCTKTGDNYHSDTINCTATNWLFNNNYQWLLSPANLSMGASDVQYSGSLYIGSVGRDITISESVLPVVVLKANVLITGGDGTSTNPYTLALNK